MDAKRRAEIFMEETTNSDLSTVLAANMVIKEILEAWDNEKSLSERLFAINERYRTALMEITDPNGVQSGVCCAMVAHAALYPEPV